MNTFFVTLLFAMGAIIFMGIGLMITYWRKGYHLESDVGNNRHMKAKGIGCTSQRIMEEERAIFGDSVPKTAFCSSSCGDCTTPHCDEPAEATK